MQLFSRNEKVGMQEHEVELRASRQTARAPGVSVWKNQEAFPYLIWGTNKASPSFLPHLTRPQRRSKVVSFLQSGATQRKRGKGCFYSLDGIMGVLASE